MACLYSSLLIVLAKAKSRFQETIMMRASV